MCRLNVCCFKPNEMNVTDGQRPRERAGKGGAANDKLKLIATGAREPIRALRPETARNRKRAYVIQANFFQRLPGCTCHQHKHTNLHGARSTVTTRPRLDSLSIQTRTLAVAAAAVGPLRRLADLSRRPFPLPPEKKGFLSQ